MKSFIIHLPGDHKRAPNAQALLEHLPGAEIVDAVLGRAVMDTALLRPGDLHRPPYPFPLSPGEVGCFLSHRACWQRIVAERLEQALIVEDDLAIDPGPWAEAMVLVADHAGPDCYIRLPAKPGEKPGVTLAEYGAARLFLPRRIGLQTVAQVVGRNAAARLLAASTVIDRPIDAFLQMHWVTGQPVHTILPCGVRELTRDLGGSTIQKKPAGNRLAREARRALYRARIALHRQRPKTKKAEP